MTKHPTTGKLAELSPETKQMCARPGTFSGGHRMCAGCPTGIFTKMLTRVSDEYEIVAGNATGRGMFRAESGAFVYDLEVIE